MHRATRTGRDSSWWVMRLKAIANPRRQTRRLAMALRPPRENGADHRVPAAVPSSARLDCCVDLGAALEGAYLFGRPGGHPVFLMSGTNGRAAAACRDRRGVAAAAQPMALTTTRSRLCATLAEQQAWAAVDVPARARRMKRSSPSRSHGQ